ncbi:hypothetical protein AGLY_012693 [Aphis glycines]|uniref:Uncharacterized protein n=1 Tax=Aphis glycines TaxID=307491 RepID=A0A6G0T8N4_APHGL|nr:hypothetical protein AGLY_012693 [Aphis glycines]
MRTVNLVVRASAALAVRECCIFWEKARISIRAIQHCIDNLINSYNEWRSLQKNSTKVGESYRLKEYDFKNKLNLLFDIAHSDALKFIKIDVDRQFVLNQRLPGRPRCLLGKNITGTVKENRNVQRKLNESNRKDNYNKDRPSTASLNFIQFDSTLENESPESSDSSELEMNISLEIEPPPKKKKKMPRKNYYYIKTSRSFR